MKEKTVEGLENVWAVYTHTHTHTHTLTMTKIHYPVMWTPLAKHLHVLSNGYAP